MNLGKNGYLIVIIGPMCSGKTTKCIERLTEFNDVGLNCCYINHSLDTRGSSDIFSSHHSGDRAISDSIDVYKTSVLSELDLDPYQIVAIDEGQFYPDLVSSVIRLHQSGKIVILSGLSGNHKRERFGALLDLIPLADELEHLKAYCKPCLLSGTRNSLEPTVSRAAFTIRLIDADQDTLIGFSDVYAPVCGYHYYHLTNMTSQQRHEYCQSI